jgi:methyl coenzyme M reductase beta subunit
MALKANLDIAQRLDITCRKGDTFELIITITDSTGAALDLTTYTDFELDVRPTDEDAGTPALTFVNADFAKTATGVLTATKSYSDMESVEAGTFVYDLQATDGSAVRTTWFYGLFTIIDDITIA